MNGDIPGGLADEYGIVILPQYYRFDRDDTVYGDERNLSSAEFFARLSGGERAYSMGCNPQRVRELLEPRLAAGEDIICLMFSSALSGSYNTVSLVARQLCGEYPERRIKVIDTLNASFAQGLLAYRAAKRRLEGRSFDEIVQAVESEIPLANLWFAVNDLKYLALGGRLGGVSACIGTVLDIKPVLTVNEAGQIVARHKVRTLRKAVAFMTDLLREKQGGYPELGIVHSGCEVLAGRLRERILEEKPEGVEEIIVSEINPTIGAHIGPDAVGVVFLQRPDVNVMERDAAEQSEIRCNQALSCRGSLNR